MKGLSKENYFPKGISSQEEVETNNKKNKKSSICLK